MVYVTVHNSCFSCEEVGEIKEVLWDNLGKEFKYYLVSWEKISSQYPVVARRTAKCETSVKLYWISGSGG